MRLALDGRLHHSWMVLVWNQRDHYIIIRQLFIKLQSVSHVQSNRLGLRKLCGEILRCGQITTG